MNKTEYLTAKIINSDLESNEVKEYVDLILNDKEKALEYYRLAQQRRANLRNIHPHVSHLIVVLCRDNSQEPKYWTDEHDIQKIVNAGGSVILRGAKSKNEPFVILKNKNDKYFIFYLVDESSSGGKYDCRISPQTNKKYFLYWLTENNWNMLPVDMLANFQMCKESGSPEYA